MTEAKVVELVKEWKDELRQLIGDYNQLLGKLDSAVTIVNSTQKKWWVEYRTLITIIVSALALVTTILGTLLGMKYTDTCIVNIGDNGQSIGVESCKNYKK